MSDSYSYGSVPKRLVDYEAATRCVPEYDGLSSEIVKGLLDRHPRPRVLEVGSGTGFLSRRLLARREVEQLTCVDPDVEACELLRARARGTPQLAVLGSRVEDMPLLPRFDAVVSRFSLHHVPDANKLAFLVAQRERLEPGGRLVLGDMTLPHYQDEAARPGAVERYYGLTETYARRRAVGELLLDQADCRANDLARLGEYKICRCRTRALIEQAGFSIDQEYKLRPEPGAAELHWPGLFLVCAAAPPFGSSAGVEYRGVSGKRRR